MKRKRQERRKGWRIEWEKKGKGEGGEEEKGEREKKEREAKNKAGWLSSGDVMYHVVTKANNTVSFIWK